MKPDKDSLLTWLRRAPVTDEGQVLSWMNPTKAGYPYPEAAGLWLGLFSTEGAPLGELEHRVARALVRGVSADGSVGRRGIEYPFDTAVALRGLLAFERAGGAIEDPAVLYRMFDYLARSIVERRAVLPDVPEDRWSTRYNPHLLKLVIVISDWSVRTSDPRCRDLIAQLHSELAPKALEWFRDPQGAPPRYAHAVCYATEAMLHLAGAGVPGAREGAARAAEWLVAVQHETGGIPAWSGPGPEERLASDATAQAIGIWTAVNATRYAPNVTRAFGHLARVQHDSGGIRYSETSSDVNTWCTIFAVDALNAAASRR